MQPLLGSHLSDLKYVNLCMVALIPINLILIIVLFFYMEI